MKLLILSLLVLTSLCFVLADEEPQPDFADFAANDGDMPDDAPEDYVEDDEDNVSSIHVFDEFILIEYDQIYC